MPRQIAFLRAINVGGHIVKMERLKQLFESLKLKNVETFIASGNVIFDSARGKPDALERKIEEMLEKELGYEVKTFIRSDAELAKIAAYRPPFDEASDTPATRLFIGFLATAPGSETKAKLAAAATDVDDFHIDGRELYWRCRVASHESKFSGTLLEKTLGMATTLRNANTVQRLVAKYPPG